MNKRLSRPQYKVHTERDLEREYLRPSGRVTRSAKEFVEWFYSPPDDVVEDVMGVNFGGDVEMGDLEREIGREAYEELVREHYQAQEQLERQRVAQVKELETLALSRREEGVCVHLQETATGSGSEDGDWDLVSTTSSEEIVLFEDWEDIILVE